MQRKHQKLQRYTIHYILLQLVHLDTCIFTCQKSLFLTFRNFPQPAGLKIHYKSLQTQLKEITTKIKHHLLFLCTFQVCVITQRTTNNNYYLVSRYLSMFSKTTKKQLIKSLFERYTIRIYFQYNRTHNFTTYPFQIVAYILVLSFRPNVLYGDFCHQ